MIKKITVKEKTTASKIFFFKELDIMQLPDPHIVMLFGANGVGKTSLIKLLNKWIDEKGFEEKVRKIANEDPEYIEKRINAAREKLDLICELDSQKRTVVYSYCNSVDNLRHIEPGIRGSDFITAFATRWDARSLSEGQSIMYSLEAFLDARIQEQSEDNNIFLFDEIDSGLSIDNLDNVLQKIKVLSEKEHNQIFMTFNNPYVLSHFPNVLSLYTGKVLHMESTDEMMKEIRRFSKRLDNKRKNKKGEYRIFD